MRSIVPDPEWLAPHVRGRKQFEYDGEIHEYVIFSVDLPRSKGAPDESLIGQYGVLGVSEAYPEKYRELGLVHEFLELRSEELGDESCVNALIAELNQARLCGVDLVAYVDFRTAFFKKLIRYFGTLRGRESSKALRRFRRSLHFLQALQKRMDAQTPRR
jgi:hypothetical protein